MRRLPLWVVPLFTSVPRSIVTQHCPSTLHLLTISWFECIIHLSSFILERLVVFLVFYFAFWLYQGISRINDMDYQ